METVQQPQFDALCVQRLVPITRDQAEVRATGVESRNDVNRLAVKDKEVPKNIP